MSDTVGAAAGAPEPGSPSGAPSGRRVAPFVALAVAIVLAALFVVLAGSEPISSTQAANSFNIGRPAPAVISTTLDDEPFDLSRRKGSWVVLNFFDPTCVPCVEEHPELIAFDEQQGQIDDGAELYTIINGRSSDEAVQAFFDDNGGEWPIVRDPTGGISIDFGVVQVPETWIIDPNGVIRVRYPGKVTAESVATQLQMMREGRG